MLFQFQLRPVDDIVPWTGQDGETLSWFGFTDGWYWLKCGGEELFRYTDDILKHWEGTESQVAALPYVDYQVVRLWEDVLNIYPAVMEPISEQVLQKVVPGRQFRRWCDELSKLSDGPGDVSDLTEKRYQEATGWIGDRLLDSGYLTQGPRISLWRDDEHAVLSWDSADRIFDGHRVWTALTGSFRLSMERFEDEVRSFDRRLIEAMGQRVAAVRNNWSRPEIQVDLEALLREQQDRSTWHARATDLAHQRAVTDWDKVLSAIDYFEKLGYPLPQS